MDPSAEELRGAMGVEPKEALECAATWARLQPEIMKAMLGKLGDIKHPREVAALPTDVIDYMIPELQISEPSEGGKTTRNISLMDIVRIKFYIRFCRCLMSVSEMPFDVALPTKEMTCFFQQHEGNMSKGNATPPAKPKSRSCSPRPKKMPKKTTPQPQPAKVELDLRTFGLENFDPELQKLCREGGGGNRVEIRKHILKQALKRQQQPPPDLIFDARHFRDPDAHQLGRLHPGMHPQLLEKFVQHKDFKPYMQQVARLWREAVEKKKRRGENFVVFVYCRWGKHRSVAIAELLQRIGVAVEGLQSRKITHLSKRHWGWSKCRGNCQECAHDPGGVRGRVWDLVEKVWKEVQRPKA